MEAPKYCPRCKNPKWDEARKVGETRGRKPGGGVVMAPVKELAAVRSEDGKGLKVSRSAKKEVTVESVAAGIPGVKMGSELKPLGRCAVCGERLSDWDPRTKHCGGCGRNFPK